MSRIFFYTKFLQHEHRYKDDVNIVYGTSSRKIPLDTLKVNKSDIIRILKVMYFKLPGYFNLTLGLGSIIHFGKHFSATSGKMTRWQEEKQRYLELSIEEKRKLYTSKNSTVISKILPWKAYFEKNEIQSFTNLPKDAGFIKPTLDEIRNIELANKVSVWQGDITTLEVEKLTLL